MAEEARAAEEAAEASKADPAKAAGLRRLHGDCPKLLSIRGPIFRFLL